jgi:hypothetical protein
MTELHLDPDMKAVSSKQSCLLWQPPRNVGLQDHLDFRTVTCADWHDNDVKMIVLLPNRDGRWFGPRIKGPGSLAHGQHTCCARFQPRHGPPAFAEDEYCLAKLNDTNVRKLSLHRPASRCSAAGAGVPQANNRARLAVTILKWMREISVRSRFA